DVSAACPDQPARSYGRRRGQRASLLELPGPRHARLAAKLPRSGGRGDAHLARTSLSRVRAVVQRVSRASVRVDGEVVGSIGPGLCVLLSVGPGDDVEISRHLASRIAGLRIFPDDAGR